MFGKPAIAGRIVFALVVCVVLYSSGSVALAQSDTLRMDIGNASGFTGDLVTIPLYLSTEISESDSCGGFDVSVALNRPDFLDDPRFKSAELRDLHKDERLRITQEAIAPFMTGDLLERLEHEDVPCAPVLKRREMRQHPQVVANGILMESEHHRAGPLRQTHPPARFSSAQSSNQSVLRDFELKLLALHNMRIQMSSHNTILLSLPAGHTFL